MAFTSFDEDRRAGASSLGEEARIHRPSLSKQVASVIRDYVLTGRLRRGDRIVQAEWAERLQVSRMPVRDAINLLTVEGTLVQPRGGSAVVADIDPRDVRDGYELNAIISSFAARRAAEMITDEQLSQLERIHEGIDEAVRNEDRKRAQSLNWDFHRLVNQSARSARLMALLRLLSASIPHSAFELIDTWPQQAVSDHAKILQALRDRDAGTAGQLMYEHIEAGSRHMVAELETRLVDRSHAAGAQPQDNAPD